MATGRTVDKWTRAYINGYDVSGHSRTVGPLAIEHDEGDVTAWQDTVKGYLKGHTQVNLGALNAIFDNTATTGLHAVLETAGGARTVLIARGIQAAPADGDPAFGGIFTQGAYQVEGENATIPFLGWAEDAGTVLYASPWGTLLHALAARTAATGANTDAGFDNPTEAATTRGGYFLYQVTAGNGTATLSVDDSANNADWLALSGATSGSITCAAGVSGLVAIGAAATVRRYLRWQIAFGAATSVTFACAFMRAF